MRITLRPQDFHDAPFFQQLECDQAPFFTELEGDIFEQYDSPFFSELYEGIEQDRVKAQELLKRQLHRDKWRHRAYHTAKRIKRVKSIDLHRMAGHIADDWFGNSDLRFSYVKQLHDRRACILWYLEGLYYYFAFNEKSHNGWFRSNGLTYAKQRPIFAKLLAEHRAKTIERNRQAKWDKKRERVKKTREKKRAKADVPRHRNRTQFNGLNYVDPQVRRGQYAMLDDGFSYSRIVIVKELGKVFARVAGSAEGKEFGVLVVRLTRLEDK